MTQNRYATPLELFIDFLQAQTELPELTEKGVDALRQHVRTALPFLPAIVMTGQWPDCTCGPVADACRAIVASEGPAETPDDAAAAELEANYIVGLIAGLGLAHALCGTRVARHAAEGGN